MDIDALAVPQVLQLKTVITVDRFDLIETWKCSVGPFHGMAICEDPSCEAFSFS
jgi:hypothetical protein